MAGLVSHSDGLVDSALRCLHNVDLFEGLSMNYSPDGSVHISRLEIVDLHCTRLNRAFSISLPIL